MSIRKLHLKDLESFSAQMTTHNNIYKDEKRKPKGWQKKNKDDHVDVEDVAKMSTIQSERPVGITILGIAYIVFGILMITAVAIVVTFTAMMGDFSSMMGSMMGNTMTVFTGLIAVGVGILAAVEFAIAWALFSGKSWGRITVIVLSIADLIIHCVTLAVGNLFAIPHIIIDLIVLFYMWKPNVINYFNQKNISLTESK